jgi:Tol biopolymer transport system component
MLACALVVAGAPFATLHRASVLAQGDTGPGLIVFSSNRSGDFEIYVLDPETGLTVQLTNSPGNDIEPLWSPDGSQIAFTSDRDGDYELFVMLADGSDLRQVTKNLVEDRQPRWQPGGEHIV